MSSSLEEDDWGGVTFFSTDDGRQINGIVHCPDNIEIGVMSRSQANGT